MYVQHVNVHACTDLNHFGLIDLSSAESLVSEQNSNRVMETHFFSIQTGGDSQTNTCVCGVHM